jgi:hypothetical protein
MGFYPEACVDPYIGTSLILNLCQIGELIGGSQREERLEYLEARLDDFELNKDSYWWYLDLRRYGSGEGLFCLKLRIKLATFVTGALNNLQFRLIGSTCIS